MSDEFARRRRRVLTDKMVSELPRKAKPYFLPDPEMAKHNVRVQPNGPPHAYYIIARGPDRRQVWKKIGDTGAALPIAEARTKARVTIARIEAGLPPVEAPRPAAETVAAVAEAWLKRYVEKHALRTAKEQRRVITKYVLPQWGERSFVGVLRSDIAKLLDHVEDHHGPAQADAVLAALRMIGSWYRDREDNYVSPFVGVKRRVAKPQRKRTHMLDDGELRAVWQAIPQAGTFGALVTLLLLTAQRLTKVRTMRWSDIGSDGTWTIPRAPREKGNAGTLTLPPLALRMIEAQPRILGNDFVFAGDANAPKAFDHRTKLAFDQLSGVAGWRLHDLRRTARSLMSRAGVSNDHAELVLGHARPTVEQIYDRFHYRAEKAEALRKLAALIERIVKPPPDNVVPLHQTEAAS